MFLIARDGGGWGAVRRLPEPAALSRSGPDRSRTIINHQAATLAQLYASICTSIDRSTQVGTDKVHTGYEQIIRETIAAAYDDTDPTECAEQTLVALGTRPRIVAARLL